MYVLVLLLGVAAQGSGLLPQDFSLMGSVPVAPHPSPPEPVVPPVVRVLVPSYMAGGQSVVVAVRPTQVTTRVVRRYTVTRPASYFYAIPGAAGWSSGFR